MVAEKVFFSVIEFGEFSRFGSLERKETIRGKIKCSLVHVRIRNYT